MNISNQVNIAVSKNMNFNNQASLLVSKTADALELLANNIPVHFADILGKILNLKGRVVISGIGKSGYIAHKIAASLASTGTPAFYIHPAEASHGDLGMITEEDLVMLFSNSGQTRELNDIINYCRRFDIPIAGVTMNLDSNLAKYSNYLLLLPKCGESSSLNAPTVSCSLMLALGDALMTALHEARGLTPEAYKAFHPGGKIGADLMPISSIMHTGAALPIAAPDTLMSEIIVIMSSKGFGCCAIVDKGKLVGIITDGDLRRHMGGNMLSCAAADIMSKYPKVLCPDTLAIEALKIMNEQSITNFLIVENSLLVGIIHIHDLLRAGV